MGTFVGAEARIKTIVEYSNDLHERDGDTALPRRSDPESTRLLNELQQQIERVSGLVKKLLGLTPDT